MSTKLRARRLLIAGGRRYSSGAIVPDEAVRGRRAVLLRTHYLEEVDESEPVVVQPVDLPPPPAAPKKKPKLKIIRLPDPVHAWHETFKEARKHFDNDAAAMDFLMAHQEARDLYKTAVAVGVAEEKQKRKGRGYGNTQTVSPNEIGL